uniref:Butyrophilin-like protein 1 n=1 Tax=Sus scrofa TaxID=9823 RepID=A0A8D0RJF8_PIG
MEDLSCCPVLCRLTPLLLLIQLLTGGSLEEFSVLGPSDPIVAVLGGDAVLSCRVFPAMNAEDMELRWFRSKFSEAVFIYQNRQEQKEEQLAGYAGRASLVRDFLSQGEAAVRIGQVQVSDNGLYTCFFRKGVFYEEASLELKVAGVGSAPEVRITGPEEDGIRVLCTASGWFPKPQVQWRDGSGEKFLAFSEAHTQDAEGLFSVEAALVVRDRSVGNVTCSVLNPVLGQEKAMAIFIPEPFFPQASPWKVAFLVSLTVLMLLVLGAGCYIRREHSIKLREMEEKRHLWQAKEEARQTKEKALQDRAELQAQLNWRKDVYLAGWKKAQLYADWRTEKFQPRPVTLDPGSAASSLVVTHEKTSVTRKNTGVNPGDMDSVLGFEDISSGRWYWEVEIKDGDGCEWALGVCRKDVKREGWYKECPEKGFWLVGKFSDKYFVCRAQYTELSLRQVLHRVGVFLDHEEGDVSFYNMTDGSHIFSFTGVSFSGALCPYFKLRAGDVSLTICSKVGGSEGLPVPLNDSCLEEPVSLPGEEISSGSGADAPPGAESPLLPCNPEAVSP